MAEGESRNEQLVRSFFDTLSTGDLEKVRPLLHEQAVWTVMSTGIPGTGERKGRDVIIDDFLAPVRGMFVDGDPKVKIRTLISKGPLVAAETRALGRFKNGKQYDNQYAWMIEVRDDKVYSLHEYMDSYYISTLV